VLGYAQTCDAYRMTASLPDGTEAARAMRTAIADAGLAPTDIGYMKAHGSATPLNDATEVLAIHKALGARTERVPISGTKGLHAHALGASGAIEAAIASLALHHGYLPATANLQQKDPACDLDVIQGQGRRVQVECALCTSFGFGGINVALALARASQH
jgi:3-oxoacyl-[acyl-carrier-protein] synthase II